MISKHSHKNKIRYLTPDQILLTHSLIVDETTGSHGIRDRASIASAVEQPKQMVFGKELYPTLFEKAAVYARSIIMSHPFLDGNKRTGISVAIIFLEENRYTFVAEKRAIEKFALKIVHEHLEIPEIARWLEDHVKKL